MAAETPDPAAAPDSAVDEIDPAAPAVLRPCSRCGRTAMLRLVGRCADCIADLTFHHPEEYAEFRAEVKAEYGAAKAG
ncbi:MAG: hypothetical protein AB7J32_25070 [Pseudonocardia sp.]